MNSRQRLTLLGALLFAAAPLFGGWQMDTSFRVNAGFGFSVGDIVGAQPDGKIVVDRGRGRLNADGSVDATYRPSNDGRYAAWVSPTGQIVVSLQAGNLNWLNADGSAGSTTAVLGFPGTGGGQINDLLFLTDGSAYAVGGFLSVNGVSRIGLARFRANGTLDTAFDAGTGGVGVVYFDTRVQSDGKLLLCGTFSSYAGFARSQIVRLNLDGTVDNTFDPGPPLPSGFSVPFVDLIASEVDGTLLRVDDNALRRCEANGGNPIVIATFEPRLEIQQIAPLPDGKILVAGNFTRMAGADRKLLARLNHDGTLDPTFDFGGNVVVPTQIFLQADGRILLNSDHTSQAPSYSLRLLSDGRADATFRPATKNPAIVSAVTPGTGGTVFIGGAFTHIDGLARTSVARLNADGSVDPAFDSGQGVGISFVTNQSSVLDRPVGALAALANGKVLVGGTFSTARTLARQAIARFNADGSIDAAFDAQLNSGSSVQAIAVQADDRILIGGTFTTVAGTARARLARLLPDGTLDTSFTVTSGVTGTNAVVRHISITSAGKILVAGLFDAWNGARRWSVMRLNIDGTLDTAFDPASATSGFSINSAAELSDGTVAIGGSPANFATQGAFGRVSGTGAFMPASGLDARMFYQVTAVVPDPAGGFLGSFQSFGGSAGIPQSTVERVAADDTSDARFVPETVNGSVLAMSRQTSGAVLVAGDFSQWDGMDFANVARIVPTGATPDLPRLANLSTRGYLGAGADALIAGFVVEGSVPQRVMIRGVGRSLSQFGLTGVAGFVGIRVFRAGESAPFASNNSWYSYFDGGPTYRLSKFFGRFGAFPLPAIASRIAQNEDSALILDLPRGAYTVQLTGSAGIALAEIYNVNGLDAPRRLVNLSTRGRVEPGDRVLIGGIVIDRGTKRVLIRAVGPGLSPFNVPGVLADPILTIVRTTDGVVVATNDNWHEGGQSVAITAATHAVLAFDLADGSKDAALVLDLPPGTYTGLVSGAGNTSGIALIEVYEMPVP